MKDPCYKCGNRVALPINCHIHCKLYKEFSEYNKIKSETLRKENELNYFLRKHKR